MRKLLSIATLPCLLGAASIGLFSSQAMATGNTGCNSGYASGGSGSGICEGETTFDFRGSGNYYVGNYQYTSTNSTTNTTISGWSESSQGGAITNVSNTLVTWGSNGLGIYEGQNSPDHGVDNSGPDEFILFTFEEAVSLTCFSFGWPDANGGTDYDASLAYWDETNGNMNAASNLSGNTIAGLGAEGWKLAGDYTNNGGEFQVVNNDARADTTADTLNQGIFSRYWILGTYMSSFTGTTLTSNYGGNDFFKLASISVVKAPVPTQPGGEVPVPATFALLLGGLALLSRRLKPAK